VLALQTGNLLALDHLEARVAAQNLVERLCDALFGEGLLALEESLLLAGVKHRQSWNFALLEVEDCGEVRFRGHVEAHKTESDAALYLAREDLLHVVNGLDHGGVAGRGCGHCIDHTQDAVLLQADVVGAFFAQERHGFRQPRARCAALHGLLFLLEDERLRVSVDKLKERIVAEFVALIADRLLQLIFQDEEVGELRHFVLLEERLVVILDKTEFQSFLSHVRSS